MSIFQVNPKSSIRLAVSLIGLTAIFTVTPARAATVNAGFEAVFTGWSAIGNTTIQNSSFGSGPTEGNSDALLSAPADNSDALPTDLENFLGLQPYSLDGINGSISHGSAIQQVFTATAGEQLSFQWNFLTTESQDSVFNDFAFVSIFQDSALLALSKLGDTFSPLTASQTLFDRETGFQTFSYTLPTTGTYTLGIGVASAGDAFGQSGLLVDSASAVPTPVPGLGLLAIGVLSLGSRLSRRQPGRC